MLADRASAKRPIFFSQLVTNLEPLAHVRIAFGYVDRIDDGRRRPVSKQLDHQPNGVLLARNKRFDASIGAVANPARYAELIGLLLRPGAEEYALDSTSNADAAADASHQTTLMSGASSAFMPTTL